jgi:K+-transporting ATPase ATPase C chain
MRGHLRANLWLLALSVLICSVLYPLVLLVFGQAVFSDKAEGSLMRDKAGTVIGSRLIAQPFTADEYFWPRPSAASYNGAASGASNWGANNYLLRDRVARALGPIVKYRSGPQRDQLAAPDIEHWFQNDRAGGKPGIVAQWAQAHSGVAQAWVKADKLNADYVLDWQRNHAAEVAQWIKDNPDTLDPKPEDLAVPFFQSFSKDHPGKFPSPVEHKTTDGKTEKKIEPVKEGADIQGYFFDMWLQEHSDADFHQVPADMVVASGSGLDPHITLDNARYQLDRVAGAWATKTKRDQNAITGEIEALLDTNSESPLGGLAGGKLINVLEINLQLKERFGVSVVQAIP